MKKLLSIIVLAFFIVSCDSGMRKAQNYNQQKKAECSAQTNFSRYSACEQNRLNTALYMYRSNWRTLPGADLVDLYFAYLNALNDRFLEGSVSSSDAFLQAYQIKTKIQRDIENIESMERQKVNQALTGALVGLGMYYDSLNSYNYATGNNATTIYNIKGDSIICTTMNNVVVCN